MKKYILLLTLSKIAFAQDIQTINLLGDKFTFKDSYKTEIEFQDDLDQLCADNKRQIKSFRNNMKRCLDAGLTYVCQNVEKNLIDYNESIDDQFDPSKIWIGKFSINEQISSDQFHGTNVKVSIGQNAVLSDIETGDISEGSQVSLVEEYLSEKISKEINFKKGKLFVTNKFLLCDLYKKDAHLKGKINLEIENIKHPSRTDTEAARNIFNDIKSKKELINSMPSIELKYARLGFELAKSLPKTGTLSQNVNFENALKQLVTITPYQFTFTPYMDADDFIQTHFPIRKAAKSVELNWENK